MNYIRKANDKSIYKFTYNRTDLDKLSLKMVVSLDTNQTNMSEYELNKYQLERINAYRNIIYPEETRDIYNGDVIDIKKLPKERLSKAFKMWAEGSPALENLLWVCYENGIDTRACCAGHEYDEISESASNPYLLINFQKKVEGKLAQIYDKLKDTKKVEICFNPANENNGQLTTFGIYINDKECREEIFNEIAKTICKPLKTNELSAEYKKFKQYSIETKTYQEQLPQVVNQNLFAKLRQTWQNLKERFKQIFKIKNNSKDTTQILQDAKPTTNGNFKLSPKELEQYNLRFSLLSEEKTNIKKNEAKKDDNIK